MTDQSHDPTSSSESKTSSQPQRTSKKIRFVCSYVYIHLIVLIGTVLADLRCSYHCAPWPGWMRPLVKPLEYACYLPDCIEIFYMFGLLMILGSPIWLIVLIFAYQNQIDHSPKMRLFIAEFLIVLCQMLAILPGCQ